MLLRLMASLPPHTELNMPALSPTMSQGNIAFWMVNEGDEIAPGDVLCDVETDKAIMAWENQDDGFVAKILKPSGTKDIPVGTPVAILVEDDQHVSAFVDYKSPESCGVDTKAPEDGPVTSRASKQSDSSGNQRAGQKASSKMGPAARVLLEEHCLSPDDVTPSGPQDIITKGDVLVAIASGKGSSKPQQPSKLHKQEWDDTSDSQAQTLSMQKGINKQPQPLQEEPSQMQPSFTGDSKIRAVLAKKLLEEGNQIPAQWLEDWTLGRQTQV